MIITCVISQCPQPCLCCLSNQFQLHLSFFFSFSPTFPASSSFRYLHIRCSSLSPPCKSSSLFLPANQISSHTPLSFLFVQSPVYPLSVAATTAYFLSLIASVSFYPSLLRSLFIPFILSLQSVHLSLFPSQYILSISSLTLLFDFYPFTIFSTALDNLLSYSLCSLSLCSLFFYKVRV